MTSSQFCCLVGGLFTPGMLVPSPVDAIGDPLQKYLLFGWWSSPVQLLPKSLKEAVADSTWVQSNVLICVVSNSFKQVRRSV